MEKVYNVVFVNSLVSIKVFERKDNNSAFSDPPEIELETDRVHSGRNKEAHLTCNVQGNPVPLVSFITI